MLQNIFFYHEWIAGENGTHGIHCYITRGRVGARKREKDAEERNNKITVELQLRKRKLQEKRYQKKARGFIVNRQNTCSKQSNG